MIDSSNLIFKADTHQYFTKQGQELAPVSHVIKKYCQKFDPTGEIIARCAARDGKTVEEKRKEWDEIRDTASDKGNSFHRQAEHWVKTKTILDDDYKDVISQLTKIPFKGTLHSEVKLFSEELGIAGTSDLMDQHNGIVDIYDFKTNKELKKKSFFDVKSRQYKYMLSPVSHLMDCNFVHYSLQLSIYQILLEEHGYWVNDKTLLYITPKTRQIKIHPTLPLYDEAWEIINDFKRRQSW